MRKLLPAVLCIATLPLFGQFPSNTVTISAARTVSVQPDQAVLSLTVTSSPGTNLEQIVSPLSGLGITPLNLSGVNSSSATMLQWNFSLAVPLSNLTATLASLTNLVQNIAQNASGLTLTFNVIGVQASAQLVQAQQAQTCSNVNLISDATAQAQKLVAAAGMALGPIRKLSNATLSNEPAAVSYISGYFALPEIVDFLVPTNYSPPSTCSLTVQFQLLP